MSTLSNVLLPNNILTTTNTATVTNKTFTAPIVNGPVVTAGTYAAPVITAEREVGVNVASSNIDLSTANYFNKTITGNTTFTVSNAPISGVAQSFVLELTNGGAFTITWFAGLTFPGGVAPTLTAAGRDVLSFFTRDGGTTWSGFVVGKDVK